MNRVFSLLFLLLFTFEFADKARAQGPPPTPHRIISLSCDQKPEMFKFVNLSPYPDSTTTEWFIPSSGLCNSDYWKNGQTVNDLCSEDTLRSLLGNSCNRYTPGVDCFTQDSSASRMMLHINPKSNTTLEKFAIHYALVAKSTMSTPNNKPNLAQKLAVKIVDENGNILQRQQISIPAKTSQDSFFWITFTLKQNLLGGKHYHMYIFGYDPLYPNEVNTNFPIWESFGFKATYKCAGLKGTCNWDSIPKQIWRDPFYEFPCNASESWEWKSSCDSSKIIQFDFYDNQGPKIVKCPEDVTISLPKGSCEIDYVVPPVKVIDNCAGNLIKVAIETPFGEIEGNGGVLSGVRSSSRPYIITYTAKDICENEGVPCSYNLTVKEEKGFTAVCVAGVNATLAKDGCAYVLAKSFHKGPIADLCCPNYKVKARIMGQGAFKDTIKACCSDLGKKLQIEVLVISLCDTTNTAMCMSILEVFDKAIPEITCPADMTVNCLDFDQINLAKYGKAVATANCGVSLKDTFTISLNDCNSGTVVRTFIATASNGMTATCSQTITVENKNQLQGSDIIWPKDTVLYDCRATYDPDKTGRPSVNKNYRGCSKAIPSHSDDVFFVRGNGICKKILRTWKVIDCCYSNSPLWQQVQVITLRDSVKPVITFCPADTALGNFGACTDSVLVNLQPVTASDCGGILKITNDSKYAFAKGANASGKYPNGTHKVTFTVYDSCGVTNTCSMTITVADKKPPVPICVSFGTPLQDMGPMGVMAIVLLDTIDFNVYDNCCLPSQITKSFAKDSIVKVMTFTCAEKGINVVQVYFTDCNGNQTFCNLSIDIQDVRNLCPPTFKDTLMVTGLLHRPNGQDVEDVEIKLDTHFMICSGFYKFDSLGPVEHTVKPFKDDYPLQGVTAKDIIKIQRYILGIDTSFTPYQKIAADVTRDNKITTADISELRKMILGIIPTFSKNTSWRFVPQAYKFPAGKMDWSFPEMLKVGFGTPPGDVLNADFYGVKTGDVDGSANTFQQDDDEEYEFLKIDGKYLPESEKALINIPKEFGDAKIMIADIGGRLIRVSPYKDGENFVVDLEKYPSGIYLISVSTEKWDEPYFMKVLKL